MAAVEQLSFDEINSWRMDPLKHFLKKRGLKVSGKEEELVALVFAAAEQNVPVCLDAASRVAYMQCERESLLKTPEGVLPDPSELHNGWIGELNGMTKWPPILLSDITLYIMKDHPWDDISLQKTSTERVQRGKSLSLMFCRMVKTNLYTSC